MDTRTGAIFIILVVVLAMMVYAASRKKPNYSTDLETTLRKELFTGYEVLQRPSKKVKIDVSLTILTVNELSIKDQTLSLSGYLSLEWTDSRLAWKDPTGTTRDYGNVPFLFSSETYVWRPTIIIENSVEDISVISDPNIPMRIKNTGKIIWNPSGIYKVTCQSDTTYYPLDSQFCTIIVTTWSYTANEITLNFPKKSINMEYYSENGEWELTSTSIAKGSDRSRGDQTFSSLEFNLSMRRRPLFHILTTLFPVSLMAILIAMVFRLPAASGEKIGFALTVLLAYAVYLTVISHTIPSTSIKVCYLSVYLALTLGLGTVSVILTIIVLEVHFQAEDKEIPQWVLTLSRDCMARVVCWKAKGCCRNKSKIKPGSDQIYEIKKKPLPVEDTLPYSEEAEDYSAFTWKDVSAVLDTFFFASYMFIILVATAILWLTILMHYIKG